MTFSWAKGFGLTADFKRKQQPMLLLQNRHTREYAKPLDFYA